MAEKKPQSRYSAHRGVGKWCVWDNQERKRVGGWQDQLDAMLRASKLNDAERRGIAI